MNIRKASFLLASSILVTFLSCGKQETSNQASAPSDFLVAGVDSLDLERTSDIRTFVGDSLWEYINGGAELYHAYDFVRVSTADYKSNGAEIVADIYQFAGPDFAYGLYSMLRPDDPRRIQLGVDGFFSPTNLVFVKQDLMVTLTAYQATEEVADAMRQLGQYLDSQMPGNAAKPERFSRFPATDAVTCSDKIYAESFLGQAVLTDVYSQTYNLNGDTLTLFLTDDQAGSKFLGWKDQVGERITSTEAPGDIPFDDGLSFRYNDSYYGEIVVGLVAGSLAGVVDYSDRNMGFVSAWVKSLTVSQ
ncbi:MAG: hypothetical protein JSU74_07085 [Candidatus Zixiibacteriota bacterium]|nr:MAG: hypothetical protein JSU74_07085 [candidate division Zixibacteria bacterium]